MKRRTFVMATVFILLCAWGLIAPSGPSAGESSFIFPSGNIVTEAKSIRLIGKSSRGSVILSIRNSQESHRYPVQVTDGFFQFELDLARGKNHVSISSDSGASESIEIIRTDSEPAPPYPAKFSPFYIHNREDLTGDCVQCHPALPDAAERFSAVIQRSSCITARCHAGFDRGQYQHGPFSEGKCLKCHNPHGTENRNFLKLPDGTLCFSCHADNKALMSEAKVVHFPVEKKNCTACHDPHKSDQEYHLKRSNMIELCAGCHGYSKTTQIVTHTPVESGDCIACHTPHVSEYKGLLTDPGSELCLNCHTVRKEEFKSMYIHEPVRKNCTLCHDPHGSAAVFHLKGPKDKNGRYIKSDHPVRDLCLLCHEKLSPKVAGRIINSKVRHDPVAQDKCLACHTPHSTDYVRQLKAPMKKICFSCHTRMRRLITGSKYRHGPVMEGTCADCHQPHGSDNRKLLRAFFSDKYDGNFKPEDFSLCFNCHDREIIFDPDTEKTGFRNGRKNLHYSHVAQRKKGRNCKACHEVHASDQPMHIRHETPFGRRFKIRIKFKQTKNGGTCIRGCHNAKSYDRIVPINN
jgi:predicted CXXCH cytochrome family protein